MSTRQSRCLLVSGAVHIDAPWGAFARITSGSSDEQINHAFEGYLRGRGAFVHEHENRHIQQLLAYPALFLRGLREFQWSLAALKDFRERKEVTYNPHTLEAMALDPTSPDVIALRQSYHETVRRYEVGSEPSGAIRWGDPTGLKDVVRKRHFSEAKLLEAESLAVQYSVALKRGAKRPFRTWALQHGANPSPIDDLVTLTAVNLPRHVAETAILRAVPVFAWHAFHTTWPTTSFLNFLQYFTTQMDIALLVDAPPEKLFPMVGALRFSDRFRAHCPLIDEDGVRDLVEHRTPVSDPYLQFDYDPSTWRSMIEAEPQYPLSVPGLARCAPQRWPDPLDFIDPDPSIFAHLQIEYPATSYLIRVNADDDPRKRLRGTFRRWMPRVAWRPADVDVWRAGLIQLEVAQALLANMYAQALTPEAMLGGAVEHTCWHTACPIYPTGISRYWDAIPADYAACEYLTNLGPLLNHTADRGVLRRTEVANHSFHKNGGAET